MKTISLVAYILLEAVGTTKVHVSTHDTRIECENRKHEKQKAAPKNVRIVYECISD